MLLSVIVTWQDMESRGTEKESRFEVRVTHFKKRSRTVRSRSDGPRGSEAPPSICVCLAARWMLSSAQLVSEQYRLKLTATHLEHGAL